MVAATPNLKRHPGALRRSFTGSVLLGITCVVLLLEARSISGSSLRFAGPVPSKGVWQEANDAANCGRSFGGSFSGLFSRSRSTKIQKASAGKSAILIKNLDPLIDGKALEETFGIFGKIASCKAGKGSGVVQYMEEEAAEQAISAMNGLELGDKALVVTPFKLPQAHKPRLPRRPRTPDGTGVYIKQFPSTWDEGTIEEIFSPFGTIQSVFMTKAPGHDQKTAFVNYETPDAAQKSIEALHMKEVEAGADEKLYVQLAQKKEERANEAKDLMMKSFTNVYVKNFPSTWGEERLQKEFGGFGTITSLAVREQKPGLKFAFVNFETNDQARKCIESLHMKELRTATEIEEAEAAGRQDEVGPDGHPVGKLYVQPHQMKDQRVAELRRTTKKAVNNLYVKNLDEKTDKALLIKIFEPFGSIISAEPAMDDEGKCKGFGFVCFESIDQAKKAMFALHNKVEVKQGTPLYVSYAEKREERNKRLSDLFSD